MEQINFKKLEVKEGEIVPKKNTIKHSKDNALEKHEQKALIDIISTLTNKEETKEKYLVMVHLMMSAGLRVSEAIQTRLSWFTETEDGVTINVPASDRDLRNLKRDWKTKTSKSAREVIFLDKGVGQRVRSFFISKKHGLGISRQRARQIIIMLGEKIGKPELHPHALRSTYANNLVYMGVNASTLQYYMGWANLQTAYNYVKSSKIEARRDLIEKNNNNNRSSGGINYE